MGFVYNVVVVVKRVFGFYFADRQTDGRIADS